MRSIRSPGPWMGPLARHSTPVLIEAYCLNARHAKICVGWSRHWMLGVVMVSLVTEIDKAGAEMNCLAAVQ